MKSYESESVKLWTGMGWDRLAGTGVATALKIIYWILLVFRAVFWPPGWHMAIFGKGVLK